MFKKFKSKNTKFAEEHGSGKQSMDMDGLLAVGGSMMNTLGDLLSGRIDPKIHEHHNPKVLTDNIITNINEVVKLRREIEK